MQNQTLQALRKEIDKIDDKILHLLEVRMKQSTQIAKIKKEINKKVQDPEREKILFERLLSQAQTLNIDPTMTKNIWNEILNYSRQKQKNVL